MTTTEQLTDMETFDTDNIIFSDPVGGTIPNSPIKTQRVNISTAYPDGSIGPLIIPTEKIFSFGVSENKSMEDPTKISGYSLSLSLFNRDGPTKAEKEWVEKFNKIIDTVKDHIVESRDDFKQPDLERSELKKLNPLYYKKGEDGRPVKGAPPVLYAKLISYNKKQGGMDILSQFYDSSGTEIDPKTMFGSRCNTTTALKFESIFISGGKFSLQVKVWESEVEILGGAVKRLMKARPTISQAMKNVKLTNKAVVEEEEDYYGGSGSIDEAEAEPEVKVIKKKVIKKKVIKKKAAEE
jgi:hypothetical protein